MALLTSVLWLFSFSLLVGIAVAQQNKSHIISLGSKLSPSTHPKSWPLPSGNFAFGFYPQNNGFAVGIWLVSQPENIVVWTSNRDDSPVSANSTLELTIDGRLLIRTGQGQERLIANLSFSDPIDSASMLDSGNFVLYGSNSSVVWQSFDFPTDTLLGGQNLSNGDELVSSISNFHHSSGRYLLAMQSDGNLVAYPENSARQLEDAYWNVQLLSYFGTALTTSTEWVGLQDQCDVKGFCNFNSYCSRSGAKYDCHCYPGFVWINQSEKLLGCTLNFTEDVCRKDIKIYYNITAMENTWWGDFPLSVVKIAKIQASNHVWKKKQKHVSHGILQGDFGRFSKSWRSSRRQAPVSSFFMYWHQVHSYRKISENGYLGLSEEFALRSFSYSELEKATNGFQEELARGSFGAVYRGNLQGGGKNIAVKRL
ncbi:hypothetical protein GH714_021511 [Hevea brasiliensis]|uniref:Bulb-type lectin domain-containing protein n=1 Tax=Hevea brasiliensis TaxID=3981 RepID=A0A6A6K6I0_HEVBR|nr:hypothetical protein GH714_021148 [Hevea brasiliensis]KAF2284401.1 hypothetical protein GH714_021511 [Hevea brasiliensis]